MCSRKRKFRDYRFKDFQGASEQIISGDASNKVQGWNAVGRRLIVFVYCAIQYLMNLRCVKLCWTVVSFFVLGGYDCLWDLPLILFGAEVGDPKDMIQVPAPNTPK